MFKIYKYIKKQINDLLKLEENNDLYISIVKKSEKYLLYAGGLI